MIERLVPIQFNRKAISGRTHPGFVVCETAGGDEVEVILKLSGGCDRGETSLAIEILCACLAGDLKIPIPQPYTIVLDDDWINSIADVSWAAIARRSSRCGFGSKRLPAGFGQWIRGTSLLGKMTSIAASVLLFDAVIDNPDRRGDNPNCLVKGDEIRIIDHELAFGPLLIGWRPPWTVGALHHWETPDRHIFRDALRRRTVDWPPIVSAWTALSDEQIDDYEGAVPVEWSGAVLAVREALGKIKDARDHIGDCVVEVQRVLE